MPTLSGIIGTFKTVAEINAAYPPANWSGRKALIEGPPSYEVFCDGTSWTPYLTNSQAEAVASLVSGAGISTVVVSSNFTTESAASNTALIQAALDRGGYVRLVSDAAGAIPISSTLLMGMADNTTLDVGDLEIKALGPGVGNLVRTRAYDDAGVVVAMSWSAGATAGVAWTAHGRSVGDWVWLNRADQGQFNGVFQAVTDANNLTVRLARIPTTAPTGTIRARKAHRKLAVVGGTWNYNYSGGNSVAADGLHAILMAGVYDLRVKRIAGKDTAKFLLCIGAISRYIISDVGGEMLNSDGVKVYGPSFDGTVEDLRYGLLGDDFLSFQTQEPAAYAEYDWCQGDILNATVSGLSGSSTTGALLFYGSPSGVIDGITVTGCRSTTVNNVPVVRIESLFTSGVSEFGAITLTGMAAEDARSLLQFGNGSGEIKVHALTVISPQMRPGGGARRFLELNGTNVDANIVVQGGHFEGIDNIVNGGSNTGTVRLTLNGTRLGAASWQPFRAGSAGVVDVSLNDVVIDGAPGSAMFSAPAGTGVLRYRANSTPNTLSVSMGAGSSLRLTGEGGQIDGALLDSTVANHAAGAAFYNTNAAFGAGVGKYVRGAATWVRVAA
jgi:hypothetical protein